MPASVVDALVSASRWTAAAGESASARRLRPVRDEGDRGSLKEIAWKGGEGDRVEIVREKST